MKLNLPGSLVRNLGAPLLTTLAASWRIRGSGTSSWRQLHVGGEPFIFLLWHESILPLLWWHRQQDISIVVSEARDGRYLGDYAEQLGYRRVAGSSSKGGCKAGLGALRSLQGGRPVALTPDGPRGPRRQLKPGVVRLAQRMQVPIVPIHANAAESWRLRSWDRLLVPHPFARVDVRYGTPFLVAPGSQGVIDGMHRCRAALTELESVC